MEPSQSRSSRRILKHQAQKEPLRPNQNQSFQDPNINRESTIQNKGLININLGIQPNINNSAKEFPKKAEENKNDQNSEEENSAQKTDPEIEDKAEMDEEHISMEEEWQILDFIQANDFLRNLFDMDQLIMSGKKLIYEGYEGSTLEKYFQCFSINSGIIKEIIEILNAVYNSGIEFTKFPRDHIIVNGFMPDVSFKFIPRRLSKIAEKVKIPDNMTPQQARKKYLIKMQKEANEFLMKMIPLKCHTKMYVSVHDIIPPSHLQFSEITSGSYLLDKGGFGEIYQNELFGKKVAIKFPKENPEDEKSEKKAVDRIIKEYQIMKLLPHDNIVAVYGIIKYKNRTGIVMEYCNQGNLNKYLNENPDVNISARFNILLGSAMGLEFVHSKRICHFDIKPSNIFLAGTYDPCPKLADFGLSEHLKNVKNIRPGFTLLYCSPEQIRGSSPNEKSDVWSFGMCLYYILHTRPPFDYLESAKGHRLSRKEFYNELKKKSRRPRVDEEYEYEYPRFVSLMREMWTEDPIRRPSMKDVTYGLKKSIEILNSRRR
ncbi:unnamed protein product [Blepharisma stoltei]|uniref:Protein kinase domain-containing protein n=1 Tax=Blepharisma stoltei TaxID=1481888 RepID=A0AAU9I9U1_9CILI|nr:unnamed protein product [Blepharisma stoltei]